MLRTVVMAGVVLVFSATVAKAGYFSVDFSGTYNSAAPATLISAPNTGFNFTFKLPDPFPYSNPAPSAQLTTSAYDAKFLLAGAPSLDQIQYVAVSESQEYLQVLFAQDQTTFYVSGTPFYSPGFLIPFSGVENVYIRPNGQNVVFAGSVNVTVTDVPEPASLVLLGTGLIGLASLRRQRASRS